MGQQYKILRQDQKKCFVLKQLTLFIASVHILMQHLTRDWPQVHTPWTRFRDNVLAVIADEESVRELRVEVQEELDNPDKPVREPPSLFCGVKKQLIHRIIDQLAP